MKITTEIEIDEELLKKALRSVMENYPEASTPSLQCTKWKYEECLYEFDEIDDDGECHESYTVKMEGLLEGFEKMMRKPPRCIPQLPLRQTKEDWDDWCCNMDADGIDCLLQYTLFGELVYG